MARRGVPGRLRPAAVIVAWLLAATGARADGFSGTAETGFSDTESTSTDQAGQRTHTSSRPVTGVLRLNWDRQLYERLSAAFGGNYQLTHSNGSTDVLSSQSDSRIWSVNGRVGFGDPILSGNVAYSRRSESGENRTAQDVSRSPVLVSETTTLAAAWSPLDLPRLSLLATHASNFDERRTSADSSADGISISTTYQPIDRMDLRYALRFTDSVDRLHGTESSSVQNAAGVSWSDNFFDRRATLNLSYNVGTSANTVTVTRAGGTVATQVFPIAGLSAVETLPTVPTNVTLSQNPRLVDSDTAAPVGIDIGFAPQLPPAAESRIRDIGVRLTDGVTPVNTIHVWVDQTLPFAVSGAYTWTAYRSNDNLSWTEVPLTGPVVFGEFQNRFEIPIATTAAQYLKVATRPLAPSVTAVPRFANINVTEIQVFLIVPASAAAGSAFRVAGSFSTGTRVRLLRTVSYDAAFGFTHGSAPGKIPWTLQNGLTWSDRLSPIVNAAARVERSDSVTPAARQADWRWSSSIAVDPLPTLGAGASYGGHAAVAPEGTTTGHSVGVFGRQDLYQGVGVSEGAAWSLNSSPTGRSVYSYSVTSSAAVTPHRSTSMNAGLSWSASTITGGGQPEQSSSATRVDASVSVTPVPALFGSAGLSYFTGGARPTTTYSFSVAASPFPGGDLVLRASYAESYDTVSDTRTRVLSPTARWNLGRFASLDLGYSLLAYRSPALAVDSSTLSASLSVRIR